jgi:crotonobetainyl-CoA:carnitine CoA-transferase CaiB-like acyl-CoA transferase
VRSPLLGIRVIDFGRGYGAIPGMVLADYGAEVIKVEPPAGDPWRREPAFRQWNRGKQSVVLDLKTTAGRAAALALMRSSDLVTENFRPGVMDRLGLGYKEVHALAPSLIYLSISGFGQSGSDAGTKGYEGIVAAKCGQFVIQNGYRDDGPVYDAVPKCSFGASMLGLIGTLAALHARDRTGIGQRVETSLVQANFVYSYTGVQAENSELTDLLIQVQGRDPHNDMPGYRIAQCADGQWIQSGSAMGRIFENLMQALGIEEYDAEQPPDDARLLSLIDEAYRTAPLEHWQRRLQECDAAYGTFLTTQQFMDYPQVVHNGHVIRVEDCEVGPTEQVGPLVRFHDEDTHIPESAPKLGADTSEVLADLSSRASHRGRPATSHECAALDDVLILDLSMFAAAPGGPGLLADLGARVIKIEPPVGDPLGMNELDGNELFFRVNRGKERIALDLKHVGGREAFHRLVAKADVVVHNFRPGVPERLGADFATLSAINDRIVYVYAASFGSTGPDARRPAFDAVISALAGGEILQAGTGNPPQQRQTTDHSALLGVAIAILLGLRARDLSAQAQDIETTMLVSAAYLFSDDFIRYSGKPERRLPDSDQYGLHPLYRLYRTAQAGWVFLACSDEEWPHLCAGIGRPDLIEDPMFHSPQARTTNASLLAQQLAEAFLTQSSRGPEGWEIVLGDLDIACVDATGTWAEFLFGSGTRAGDRRTVSFEHPKLGRVDQTGAAVNLSHTPGRIGTPQPFAASTANVLKEVGYSSDAISQLVASGAAACRTELDAEIS